MNEYLESYGLILWYFGLELFKNRLRAQPLEDFDHSELEIDVGSIRGYELSRGLIRHVRRGHVTCETFGAWVRDVDKRARSSYVVDGLWHHIYKVVAELEAIRQCITDTHNHVITEHSLTDDANVSEFISPGPIHETWMSDSVVPAEVKLNLANAVPALKIFWARSRVQAAKYWIWWIHHYTAVSLAKQWPRLSICVHRSRQNLLTWWWCWSKGVGPDWWRMNIAEKPSISGFRATLRSMKTDTCGSCRTSIICIPRSMVICIFRLRRSSRRWCRCLTRFSRAWLMKIAQRHSWNVYLCSIGSCTRFLAVLDAIYSEGSACPSHCEVEEIQLAPEKPSYSSGVWQTAGSDAEQIIAVGVYYFGCENITEPMLSFRVAAKEPQYDDWREFNMAARYGVDIQERFVQYLGSAVPREGRCSVFPNTLQHKLQPFDLVDKTQPGVCQILTFFLVDPTKRIPSTSVIPPSLADWVQPTEQLILAGLRRFPENTVQRVLLPFVGTRNAVNLENARQRRHGLLDDRRPVEGAEDDRQLHFSLREN